MTPAALTKQWRADNPERARASEKAYRKNNLEKFRAQRRLSYATRVVEDPATVKANRQRHHFKQRYGITPEERDQMLADQGGVCKTCGTDKPGAKGWHVDHNHTTGLIRGILCLSCNLGLGCAKDNIATLRRWISYLEGN